MIPGVSPRSRSPFSGRASFIGHTSPLEIATGSIALYKLAKAQVTKKRLHATPPIGRTGSIQEDPWGVFPRAGMGRPVVSPRCPRLRVLDLAVSLGYARVRASRRRRGRRSARWLKIASSRWRSRRWRWVWCSRTRRAPASRIRRMSGGLVPGYAELKSYEIYHERFPTGSIFIIAFQEEVQSTHPTPQP